MLNVSELIEIARGGDDSALRARSPERFAAASASMRDRVVVVWNVCRHCDLACPHCYVAAGPRPSPGDLDTSDAYAVLDDLASNGVRVVIFSGGEPLLRPDLFELLAYARAIGISAQLSTSGIHLSKSTVRKLRGLDVAYVGVSVDGNRAFNDAYRGLAGAFDRAVTGLRDAHDVGLRTGLRMTVTRRNRAQVDEVFAVAESVAASRFYVSHLVWSGRGRSLVGDDLAPSESRALLLELFALAERKLEEGSPTRLTTGSNDSDGPLLLGWIHERFGDRARDRVERLLRARGGNSAGEKLLAIDHRGRVHPDQFWQAVTLGRLPLDPFAEVLRHPFRDALRGRVERLEGRCGRCRHRALCRGSHRERALAATGNPWASDPACVMRDDEIAEPAAEPVACVEGGAP